MLERHETGPQGTFGRILLPGLILFTGELPWRENESNVSCIPPGEYQCSWTFSARFHRGMYLVQSVPSRTGIRFHSANLMGEKPPWKAQLNGCVALGEKLGWIDGQKAVLVSRPAIDKFERLMDRKPFLLEIKNL